jgi:hypothetical protein
MRIALTLAVLFLVGPRELTAAAAGASPFESRSEAKPNGPIDQLVFTRLEQLRIAPPHLCSDAVFLRRAYLDVIGTLPSGHEAQQFLLDQHPDKRRLLIDHLLERDEFAEYWAMKWSDLLRVKAEFPINLWPNAAQAYHRWIRSSLRTNQPYDRFVRDLLTSSGSNFRDPPVNFYRAVQSKEPQALAQAVALTFLGERTEKWPKEKLLGLAAFFAKVGYKATAEWKEEIVYYDPDRTNSMGSAAMFPNGTRVTLSPDRDPREVFADWLISSRNPWFTRNIANRVWAWLVGRGIIHEPDDIRPDNPPSNPELLAWLESDLVEAHYNLKQLFRSILRSTTYQLACLRPNLGPEAAANFAGYPLRRLEPEVLIDALNQITGTGEKYSSAIPEPFTFMPDTQRAIALPDGSVSSSFLELFGRPPRDTGLESERTGRITPAQRLYLLNSSHMLRKIERSQMIEYQTRSQKSPRQIASGIYLGLLSRLPTEEELTAVETYFQSPGLGLREAAVDLSWALINSAEFLYRH